jgi:hypothetical protein
LCMRFSQEQFNVYILSSVSLLRSFQCVPVTNNSLVQRFSKWVSKGPGGCNLWSKNYWQSNINMLQPFLISFFHGWAGFFLILCDTLNREADKKS